MNGDSDSPRPPGGSPAPAPGPARDRPSPLELCDVAAAVARDAGVLLLERFDGGHERALASKSSPTDLVSEADLSSERFIRERLTQARPDDGFLGEEGGGEDGSSGLTWVVDPLDGTINFLFGIPQWCVSVAVRDAQGAIAGAVFDPNRGELFTATRGGPALISSAAGVRELRGRAEDPHGEAAKAAPRAGLASAMVATGLAYDARVRAAQARVLARLVPEVRDIRRFGSAALDLAWTAAGRYDAYFERTVKDWDIAAGSLICERAGLRLLELAPAEDLPWGILVARAGLADVLHEIVAGA